MSGPPSIFFLSSSLAGGKPFTPDRLDSPLPLSLRDFDGPGGSIWTYGRYFQAIEKIIAGDSFGRLVEAAGRQLSVPLFLSDIRSILICAEKHGNLYHPAKIEVVSPKGTARFALNVALTGLGRTALEAEYRTIKHLKEVYPSYPWLPEVHFQAQALFPFDGAEEIPVSLFLADWFEGYHEFHLSIDPNDGKQKLVLWDGSTVPRYLPEDRAGQVYFQMALVLTLYYNPRTFEQIFPWHQGAGDFVVRTGREKAEVRLVTARQYGAMADPAEMPVFEALLFFFLNLSLRMRLDRLDGTGRVAWAGKHCLEMTWKGFLEALGLKEKKGDLDPGFIKNFLRKLPRITEKGLTERFSDLLASYDPAAPDLPVIKKHIVPHLTRLWEFFLLFC